MTALNIVAAAVLALAVIAAVCGAMWAHLRDAIESAHARGRRAERHAVRLHMILRAIDLARDRLREAQAITEMEMDIERGDHLPREGDLL